MLKIKEASQMHHLNTMNKNIKRIYFIGHFKNSYETDNKLSLK
jgi:hypothetical protein